jgi:hypothetical protein
VKTVEIVTIPVDFQIISTGMMIISIDFLIIPTEMNKKPVGINLYTVGIREKPVRKGRRSAKTPRLP